MRGKIIFEFDRNAKIIESIDRVYRASIKIDILRDGAVSASGRTITRRVSRNNRIIYFVRTLFINKPIKRARYAKLSISRARDQKQYNLNGDCFAGPFISNAESY